jgi:hypothetical protein
VVLTAGNTGGSITITVTDARGNTVSAAVTVQAAAAAFLKLDVVESQRSDNGDGTFTSVVGALVTDESGVVIDDGVPVEFTLVDPISGVSVTSPGFTNQKPPCTAGSVAPQPGDALSCIKYAQSLQGSTVGIQARLQTATHGVLTDVRTITLPDLRPTATLPPTNTPTPTRTATPTPAAAHLQVALFVNQASSNGDGTLSSVVSAVVTDEFGAAVNDGVTVEFSLVAPVPDGVAVTSPGFTGQSAPCTLGFPVLAQPGDALSCVKYDQLLQGQTVTIQAVVQRPSGALTKTQEITLPDLRTPTPTSTSTSTPTLTPTSTLTPTVTATPTPPAAHIQLALFVNQASNNNDGTFTSVISAVVTDANGAAVGDGVPVQFSLAAPVPAGVSVTSPALTGRAAPCVLDFTVPPQPGDALSCVKYNSELSGQTVTIQALVAGLPPATRTITLPDIRTATPTRTFTPTATITPTRTPTPTPPAAHIQLALFLNQASDNHDGTWSSVISALVTDATGAVVGNDVPVQFSLAPPVPAGVSVTSPGLTGRAAPCVLDFTVPPQPGDALSCVKYNSELSGQTVTIQALVAGLPPATRTITLPDIRTATPTRTFTFTLTVTPTPSITPTQTPTPTLPAAHIQLALFVNQASNNNDGTFSSVISAVVTDANGAAVNNDVPVQFSLVAPVPAGVSVTSPGLTGRAAPCVLDFTVPPQPGDALSCVKYNSELSGQTVTVQALVAGLPPVTRTITLPDVRTATPTRTFTFTPTVTPTPSMTPTQTPTPTPAAAHIRLALFANLASPNLDGTMSSVISALVTDATGAVVGNGVVVQFSILPVTPTPSGTPAVPAGVSVTSPGFTGEGAPCVLCFQVPPQPGDALSCVKYDAALGGQTVTIRAVVQTPSGPLVDTEAITLPPPSLQCPV